MRKVILALVVIIFIATSIFLISGIFIKAQRKKHISEKISKLPSFTFMTLTKGSFNSSEIRRGPVVVIRFHRECEHCQYEISELLKSDITASDATLILVSSDHPDSIRTFLSKYNYSDYPSVIPLADTSYVFGDIFGSNIVPANYIYNKELDLVKVLPGEVKTVTILKYLGVSE